MGSVASSGKHLDLDLPTGTSREYERVEYEPSSSQFMEMSSGSI